MFSDGIGTNGKNWQESSGEEEEGRYARKKQGNPEEGVSSGCGGVLDDPKDLYLLGTDA